MILYIFRPTLLPAKSCFRWKRSNYYLYSCLMSIGYIFANADVVSCQPSPTYLKFSHYHIFFYFAFFVMQVFHLEVTLRANIAIFRNQHYPRSDACDLFASLAPWAMLRICLQISERLLDWFFAEYFLGKVFIEILLNLCSLHFYSPFFQSFYALS
jgi:hypothetical protein